MDHDRFKMHGVLHWYSANIYIQLSNHYGCLRLGITLMAGAAKLCRGRVICPYLILVSSRVWESGRHFGFFISEVFVEWKIKSLELLIFESLCTWKKEGYQDILHSVILSSD